MSNETGWGGKREGTGRRPPAQDGTERKIIKKFAQILKENPAEAEKIMKSYK